MGKSISVFNRKSVYDGRSIADFNAVRNILELNKIPYKYTTLDLEHNSYLGPEKGVTRSLGGNFKETSSSMIYEVFVHKDDYDEAMWLIRKKMEKG